MTLEKRQIKYFNESIGTDMDKLNSLSRFMTRQNLAKLACYMEIFKMTKGITGSILDCGVYFGNGMMTWAKLSAVFEPYNYNCKVIGFDTFTGNTTPGDIDIIEKHKERFEQKEGGYFADSYDDLKECIAIFDEDRPLNQFDKIEMVKGDLCKTAEQYVEDHPELVVRILCLSVNLYEPTKAAIKAFLRGCRREV
jgi:hypothetical protein